MGLPAMGSGDTVFTVYIVFSFLLEVGAFPACVQCDKRAGVASCAPNSFEGAGLLVALSEEQTRQLAACLQERPSSVASKLPSAPVQTWCPALEKHLQCARKTDKSHLDQMEVDWKLVRQFNV